MTPVTEQALYGNISHPVPTILVVEDENLIRLTLIEFLEDQGYNVLDAANVAEAKQVFATNPHIDLVFSDINMPGTENGFALARWIYGQFPGTKVLLTSGAPHSHEDTKDLLEPMIPKPYNWNSVLRRIQSQL
jgi:CheY-like chemotaxis protein